jgi:hypothetical protein
MYKSHASTITHVIGWCLCKAVFALGIVLFTGCATKPTQSSNETSLPSWLQQNRLFEATETEVETAKSSEVPWINGRADLGFSCYTNWKLVKKERAKIVTHMDHIDGNHLNNDPANLQELCPYCHDTKSNINGDKDPWRNRRS